MKAHLAAALLALAGCTRHAADIPAALLAGGAVKRPTVVLSSPSALTPNVPVTTPVFVEFDSEMDLERTRQAFSLTGSAPTPGRLHWSGKRLIYAMDAPLPAGNSFLLTQGAGSKSLEGYLMEVDYLVHFVAGASIVGPQVLGTTPGNNAQNVSTASTIRVIFSAPMDHASTQNAFSISPAAPGSFSWDPDDRGFTYTPFAPLSFAAAYSVQLSIAAKDQSGLPLAGAFHLVFQAGTDFVPPQILNVFEVGNPVPLVNGVAGVRKDASIRIDFSEPVQFLATQGAFSISRMSDSTVIAGVFQWNPGFTSVTFLPSHPLEPLHLYRLTIGTGTLDTAGNSLQTAYSLDFTISNALGAVNSDYLAVTDITKTIPAPVELLTVSPLALTTLNVAGCATGQAMNLRLTFDHSLEPASIAQNIAFTKTLGINPHSGQIIGLSFSSLTLPNDRLTVWLNDVGCNEYELKLFGKKAGVKSGASGTETGTWLSGDVLTYMRVQ